MRKVFTPLASIPHRYQNENSRRLPKQTQRKTSASPTQLIGSRFLPSTANTSSANAPRDEVRQSRQSWRQRGKPLTAAPGAAPDSAPLRGPLGRRLLLAATCGRRALPRGRGRGTSGPAPSRAGARRKRRLPAVGAAAEPTLVPRAGPGPAAPPPAAAAAAAAHARAGRRRAAAPTGRERPGSRGLGQPRLPRPLFTAVRRPAGLPVTAPPRPGPPPPPWPGGGRGSGAGRGAPFSLRARGSPRGSKRSCPAPVCSSAAPPRERGRSGAGRPGAAGRRRQLFYTSVVCVSSFLPGDRNG